MSDLIASLSFFAACVGAWYAFQAYQSSKEVSFPKHKAHTQTIDINHLSKEAKKLHDFIGNNVDRLVYLNVRFDIDEFEFNEQIVDKQKITYLNIWYDKIEKNKKISTEELSVMNCLGLNLSIYIAEKSDTKVGFSRFGNILHGYFYIIGYSGPHQGYMGATIRTAVRE